jgi:hypothetical protein
MRSASGSARRATTPRRQTRAGTRSAASGARKTPSADARTAKIASSYGGSPCPRPRTGCHGPAPPRAAAPCRPSPVIRSTPGHASRTRVRPRRCACPCPRRAGAHRGQGRGGGRGGRGWRRISPPSAPTAPSPTPRSSEAHALVPSGCRSPGPPGIGPHACAHCDARLSAAAAQSGCRASATPSPRARSSWRRHLTASQR